MYTSGLVRSFERRRRTNVFTNKEDIIRAFYDGIGHKPQTRLGAVREGEGTRLPFEPQPQGHRLSVREQVRFEATRLTTFLSAAGNRCVAGETTRIRTCPLRFFSEFLSYPPDSSVARRPRINNEGRHEGLLCSFRALLWPSLGCARPERRLRLAGDHVEKTASHPHVAVPAMKMIGMRISSRTNSA